MQAILIRAQQARDAKVALAQALGATVYEDTTGNAFAVFEEAAPDGQRDAFHVVRIPSGWTAVGEGATTA